MIISVKFERIAALIRDCWGTAECRDYLDSLLMDNRGGRAGFPFEVVSALMELQAEHKECFDSRITTKKKDPWASLRPKK